jgi:hypothetical protein
MLFNPLHENARVSIRSNFDSFSNVIDSNDLQSEKHPSLMTSTLAGIKMLFNPFPENADDSISRSFDSFSNVTNFSDLKTSMNDVPMISTEKGIQRQSQFSRKSSGDDRSMIPLTTVSLRRQEIRVGCPVPGNGESAFPNMCDRLTIECETD